MANCLIAYDDFVDRGVVTASDQVATLPVVNLQTPHILPFVWRSLGSTANIACDFGIDRAVDVVALFGCNFLPATATWRIRLDSDAAFVAPHLYDTGTVATGIDTFYDACIHILPTQVTARHLRIDLADSGLTFLQVGRWFAATAWRATRNYGWGLRENWNDRSRQTRSEGGQGWVDRGAMFRSMSFSLPAVTEIETRSHVARLGRLARARDVLFVTDTASTNLGRDSVFGWLETTPEPRFDRPAYHSMSLTISERG